MTSIGAGEAGAAGALSALKPGLIPWASDHAGDEGEARGTLALGEWTVCAALAAWLVAVMAWRWPVFFRTAVQGNSPIDMAVFAYGGELWRTGGTPYLSFWDHKPPLVFAIDALGLALSGGRLWGVWVVSLAALLLALGLCYRALRAAFSPLAAAVGATYFAFSVPGIMSAGLTEWYALPISWAAALLALRPAFRERRPLMLGAALGALGAAAILLKPNLVGGPLCAAIVVSLALAAERRWVAGWRFVAGGVAGGALVAGITLGYLAAAGALDAFMDQVVHYNRLYVATGSGFKQQLRAADWGLQTSTKLTTLLLPLIGWLLAASRLVRPARLAPRAPGGPSPVALLLVVVWPVVELALAATSGRPYDHYFTTLFPPFALAVGYLGYELATRAAPARSGRLGPVAALCLALALYGPWRLFWMARDDLGGSRVAQIDATVAYVRQHLPADQPLFVWGHAADVYMLSERRPASRYVYVQPLLTPAYATPERVRDFIDSIRAEAPPIIIDASARGRSGLLIDGADMTPPLGRYDPAWSYPAVKEPSWGYESWWSMPPAMKEFYDYVAAEYVVADSVGAEKWAVYRRVPRPAGVEAER